MALNLEEEEEEEEEEQEEEEEEDEEEEVGYLLYIHVLPVVSGFLERGQ